MRQRMSNLKQVQQFGKEVLDKANEGGRPDMLMIVMLEMCMEYLAAILDELQLSDKISKSEVRND